VTSIGAVTHVTKTKHKNESAGAKNS
jgi:hypothetical protein